MDVNFFNKLVDEHSDGVYRFVLKTTKNKEISKDIVQESFEKLWINKERIDQQKAKSYLFTTAYHLTIDYFRAEQKHKLIDKQDIIHLTQHQQLPDAAEVINNALERLPLLHKQLIILRDYEGYSYEEIGQIMNLSQNQVKVYIFRARKALKDFIVSVENVI